MYQSLLYLPADNSSRIEIKHTVRYSQPWTVHTAAMSDTQ